MEFLPAAESNGYRNGSTSVSAKGKGKDQPPARVRLAWYYRPSDVSDRPTADSRLLLAAIYSELADISQLRAKCYVAHRERISDLAGWKKRPDHFYFTRLFDPYIKKEFEVIQASAVRNSAWRLSHTWRADANFRVADVSGRLCCVSVSFFQFLQTYARYCASDTNMSSQKRR
jgi:hypothetical protein